MKRWVALNCILAVVGCAGTETGNPSIQGQLTLDAHSSDPTRVGVRATEAQIVVDQAWLALGPISLMSGARCSAPTQAFAAPGLGSADHAAPEPAVLPIEIEAGEYCGLVLSFDQEARPPAGSPSALAGHAIVITGVLQDSSRFSIASHAKPKIELAAVNGSFLLGSDRAALLVGFDVARWLDGVDFPSASRRGDGSIVIDELENVPLLTAFDAAIARGIEAYLDRDADGALDEVPELIATGAD